MLAASGECLPHGGGGPECAGGGAEALAGESIHRLRAGGRDAQAVGDKNHMLTIIEIPLLKDREPYPYLDHVILVTAEPETQIQRIMQRDSCSEKQAQKILESQPDRKTYQSVADTVLHNDGDVEDLEKQVLNIYTQITKNSAG